MLELSSKGATSSVVRDSRGLFRGKGLGFWCFHVKWWLARALTKSKGRGDSAEVDSWLKARQQHS